MTHTPAPPTGALRLEIAGLHALFEILKRHGYGIVGPHLRDGAILYDALDTPDDLPIGWTDEHAPGKYRVLRRADNAYFGYVVGPHSWKRELYPPRQRLWRAEKQADGTFSIDATPDTAPRKLALIGVRACEIAAIEVHDRVLIGGHFDNADYAVRRDHALLVAVNCGQAGGTCFCVSMNTGPKARGGFDLALTEILDGSEHYFVLEIGTARGQAIAAELAEAVCQSATDTDVQRAEAIVAETAAHMGREMNTVGLRDLLMGNLDHARWDDVAARCLSCTNCTLVCPTCFCFQAEDAPDLSGQTAEHWHRWDSCFSLDHSVMHGRPVRASTKGRYRQWMTHKLATWWDQFDTSGCVGCGRCITWCPVGIDITEEVAAIRATQPADSVTATTTGQSREPKHEPNDKNGNA